MIDYPWWFVLYNVFLWFFALRYSYVGMRKYPIDRSWAFNEKPMVMIHVFIFISFYSLLTFYGGDNIRYYRFVTEKAEIYDEFDYLSIETLYAVISSFVNYNFVLWKVVVYGVALLLTYITMRKLNCYNFVAATAFTALAATSYGTTRGVLAYSIFLFGFVFLNSKRFLIKFIGIAVMISSILAHSSMALPIALIPLVQIKLTKRRVLILMVMLPFVILAVNLVLQAIFGMSSIMELAFGHKLETYGDAPEDGEVGSGSSFLLTIITYLKYVVVSLLVYLSVKAEVKGELPIILSKIVRVSFFIFYLAVVVHFCSLNNSEFIAIRYFTMIPFFLYVSWPFFLNHNDIISIKYLKPYIMFTLYVPSLEFVMITFYTFMGS